MKRALVQGDPPIEVTVKRSARARRLTLRVSRLDGRVTVTSPLRTKDRDISAFVSENENWIRKHANKVSDHVRVEDGVDLPLLGTLRRVRAAETKRIVVGAEEIVVPGPADTLAPRLQAHLRALARSELAFASDHYAERLGHGYSKLTIRDTRSRWGSCSSAGALMYSWRLILAPAEVLAYVAAHEVAHLAQMSHSPAFWDTVLRIHGDYNAPRRWLKTQGHRLHSYRFAD